MNDKNYTSSGFSLGTVLFLIFLVLKLCNVITWSWWWVTSPLWISVGLWILILAGIFIYYAVDEYRTFNYVSKKRRGRKDGK